MKHRTDLLRIWDNPQTEEVGDSVEEFLHLLGGPTWIDIAGKGFRAGHSMLPIAKQGLGEAGVNEQETDRLLAIIQQRLDTGINGATWQRSMLTQFEERMSRTEALTAMLERYLTYSNEGRPVTEWSQSR